MSETALVVPIIAK
jgi:hypothetical protein